MARHRSHDLATLEAVKQNQVTLDVLLRLARFSTRRELAHFLYELDEDPELDAETKAAFVEVASDWSFLHALDDYVYSTRVLH